MDKSERDRVSADWRAATQRRGRRTLSLVQGVVILAATILLAVPEFGGLWFVVFAVVGLTAAVGMLLGWVLDTLVAVRGPSRPLQVSAGELQLLVFFVSLGAAVGASVLRYGPVGTALCMASCGIVCGSWVVRDLKQMPADSPPAIRYARILTAYLALPAMLAVPIGALALLTRLLTLVTPLGTKPQDPWVFVQAAAAGLLGALVLWAYARLRRAPRAGSGPEYRLHRDRSVAPDAGGSQVPIPGPAPSAGSPGGSTRRLSDPVPP